MNNIYSNILLINTNYFVKIGAMIKTRINCNTIFKIRTKYTEPYKY